MADIRAVDMIPQNAAPSEERILLDYLHTIEQSRGDAFAVHIHLSELRSHFRQSHYVRIASRAFDTLVNSHDATLYALSNFDMVVFCRGVPVDELDGPIYKLRALYGEDPLTQKAEGSLDDRFSTWYDISQLQDYYTFIDAVTELVAGSQDRSNRPGGGNDGRQPNMLGEALEPANLGAINARLQAVRIDDLIHEQPAVVVHVGEKGQILFREYTISMMDLQKRVAPDVNLFANTWLFQYLSETLDRRMLAYQSLRELTEKSDPISLNLNISTIASTGFRNFHDSLEGHTDRVVIELQTVDIFADMDSYMRARDWLQSQGYRVLIDGLTPLSLQFFDPALLAADFIKVSWSSEFLGGVPEDRMVEMRDVVEHTGRDRVILSRVDSQDAIRWALGLGVSRFQGHYVDELFADTLAGKRNG